MEGRLNRGAGGDLAALYHDQDWERFRAGVFGGFTASSADLAHLAQIILPPAFIHAML